MKKGKRKKYKDLRRVKGEEKIRKKWIKGLGMRRDRREITDKETRRNIYIYI